MSSIVLTSKGLGGTLPSQLSTLSGLELLNLAYNHLSGSLPNEFSTLRRLRGLLLQDNTYLSGTLPAQYSRMVSLRNINLSQNQFKGTLPASWASLKFSTSIDLSENFFTGPLPPSWSALSMLHTLSLQENRLTGPIPAVWSAMFEYSFEPLEMDLSSNYLVEWLPPELEPSAKLSIQYNSQYGQQIGSPLIPGGLIRGPDAFSVVFKTKKAARIRALIGWVSALVALLVLSCLWLFAFQRYRARMRRRQFMKRCAELTSAERIYLEEHHNSVLMEHGLSGTLTDDTGSYPSTAAFIRNVEMSQIGTVRNDEVTPQENPVTSASTGESSKLSASRRIAPPPPKASMDDIARLLESCQLMHTDRRNQGGLGPCYVGRLRNTSVVVKVVDIPEPLYDHVSESFAKRANADLQRLQAVIPHPNLMPILACGATTHPGTGLRYL